MTIDELILKIRAEPASVEFPQVISTINENYNFQSTQFHNGIGADQMTNAAGTNEGSCRIFAFAQLHQLDETETLACFGQFYRDVLASPLGTDHANIRTFMRHGWAGISFDGNALLPKR